MIKPVEFLNKVKFIVVGQSPSAKIYLFGSRARGEAKNHSDWDFLILLNNEKISSELEKKITSPLYDLEFESGEIISPNIYSEQEWHHKYKITPFYHHVMSEGKLL